MADISNLDNFFDKFPLKIRFGDTMEGMNIFYNPSSTASSAAQLCTLVSETIPYSSGIRNSLLLGFGKMLSIEFSR